MPMNINTNIAALSAQRNLSHSQKSLSNSMERLSSGLRINSAKDDAAGLAISSRFSAQIKGMNQAARNANDGISMTMTAEGAMGQLTNNLQRMRDLAVQSANGSYNDSDRASFQNEAKQMIEEINRVAGNTQFNGTNLLDGTFNTTLQAGTNTTISMEIGNMSAAALGENTLATGGSISQAVAGTTNTVTAQTVTVTGHEGNAAVAVDSGDSAKTIAEGVNAVSARTGVRATAETTATLSNVSTGKVEFTLQGANDQAVTISSEVTDANDLTGIAAAINAQSSTTNILAQADDKGNLTLTESKGNDIRIGNATAGTGLATAKVVGTDRFDQKTGERLGPGTSAGFGDSSAQSPHTTTVGGSVRFSADASFSVAVDGAGSVLENQSQQSLTVAVAGIDLSTAEGSAAAIDAIDSAISNIAKNRAELGSVQNRFSLAIASQQDLSTNLTAARSRIQDTDFAMETATMTRSQILQQAGTALLSQANSAPQQVLSLLRG